MIASKEEEWKKRCKILNYCSCWTLCLLSKESSLGVYCWIPFLRHAWKDKTAEMHTDWWWLWSKDGGMQIEEGNIDRLLCGGGQCDSGAGGYTDLYSRQCPFAHREVDTQQSQTEMVGGMNACSEDANHMRAAVGLRPWLWKALSLREAEWVKGQRTRLFCYFLWIYSYFN